MNTRNFAKRLVSLTVLGVLAACGGDSSMPAPPPTPIAAITTQPTDQSVVAGTAATFSVVASNASHTTSASTLSNIGTKYRVVVAGAGNSVTSSVATLTVTSIPAVKAWQTAALIETDNVGNDYEPQIAIDAGGNAMAVWVQSDGTRDNIWSNRYTAGTGWGTAALIETDNAGHAVNPQIAIDVGGNALAVWMQFDGTRYNIWSNAFK